MRTRLLADGPRQKKTHKKCEENIRRHLKKKKKERQKCSNVYTFFTSTLKEITAWARGALVPAGATLLGWPNYAGVDGRLN